LPDGDIEPRRAGIGDGPVDPVAPPCFELQAEPADRRAVDQVVRQRIAGNGTRPDRQGAFRRRRNEARFAGQHRRPDPAVRVGGAEEEQRELGIELAMLVGHRVADHAPPRLVHLVRDPQARLDFPFPPVERRFTVGHRH
jgi:hypothetical protein